MRNIYILFLASNDLGVRRLVMPTGPLIVAAAIRKSPLFGRDDRVYICDTFREVLTVARRHSVDRVHFLVSSMQIIRGVNSETNPALAYLKRLKKRFPGIVSCVGGPDVSLNPDDYRVEFDVVFQGELGSLDPVEILRSETPYFRAPPADLDAEPLDYECLAGRTYLSGSIQTSRGCPNACDFCNIGHLYGRGVRTIDPDLLEERLESLARVHRGFVIIGDDNFGCGLEEKMTEFLEVIVRFQERRGFPFLFAVQAPLRTSCFPEVLGLMRAANIAAAFIGVESPSEDALAAVRKGHNLGKPFGEQIGAFTRHGIMPYISLILGLDREPGDIGERFKALLVESRTPFLMLNLINPVTGSSFRRRVAAEGRLLDHPIYARHHLMTMKTSRPYAAVVGDYVGVLNWFFEDGRLIESCRQLENETHAGRNTRAMEAHVSNLPHFTVLKIVLVYIGLCLKTRSARGFLEMFKRLGRPKAEVLYFLGIRGTALGIKAGMRVEIRMVAKGLQKLKAARLYPYETPPV
ncbi:MAG: radical SAM protein [Candidatus Aminicenantes bacterium]|nr:radical SAM protein [Candidatus Aminicenantes bacterium]